MSNAGAKGETVSDRLLVGNGPSGALFACVSEGAHHVEAAIADRRLSAILKPFLSETDARAALMAAGAVDVRVWKR